jgi:hypothetical protein
MTENDVILGLVDDASSIRCPRLAAKLRDLTISWARYSYHGTIIEHSSIDHILSAANSKGARYCLLIGYGQVLQERWRPDFYQSQTLHLESDNFSLDHLLIAGRILKHETGWYGVDDRYVLVNLKLYSELGRPSFEASSTGTLTLPNAVQNIVAGRIDKLEPAPGSSEAHPMFPGWRLIAESLRQRIPVLSVEEVFKEPVLDLAPKNSQNATAFMKYIGEGINQYIREEPHQELSQDQISFLDGVSAQAQNARRGAFLFNIEPYTDVDHAPAEPWGPVSTIYSVAAGFKPNRILQTHGFNENTRVVFFDYSPNALKIRKTIVSEWNGKDFPRFVKYLFKLFPHPENFYQLWDNRSPDDVNWAELERFWLQELQRFGGRREFTKHWNTYRKLRHKYICCDVLRSPGKLIERMSSEKNAVIWFSNAPFTVYSNWHHTPEQRKQFYDDFISQLATRNPDILIYGADYTNTSVNCISASKYWKQYRDSKHDALNPIALNRYQIRS